MAVRVLAVYPAFDPRINEMAAAWERLCATGEVSCIVLAGSHDILKGQDPGKQLEDHPNLKIRRYQSLRYSESLLLAARESDPDIIFVGVHENIALARTIQSVVRAPIILHTEFFLDDRTFLNRRYHFGIPPIRRLVCQIYRRYLHHVSARILFSNPVERQNTDRSTLPRLRYLPWPHPQYGKPPARSPRDQDFSAYIGSLSRGKGALRLGSYFSALLEAKPQFRVLFVGPKVDRTGEKVLVDLTGRFGERVQTLERCSRPEALQFIQSSLFTLSPAVRYGWGLIGDSWGTGTPVISVGEHYDLRNGENCLVARSPSDFVSLVDRLRTDHSEWQRLSDAGKKTVDSHSVDRVAEILLQFLKDVSKGKVPPVS